MKWNEIYSFESNQYEFTTATGKNKETYKLPNIHDKKDKTKKIGKEIFDGYIYR